MKQLRLENSELESCLIQISLYDKDSGKLIGGLLGENLTMGTKRRLQKIHKVILGEFNEFLEDFKKLDEFKKDSEKYKKEVEELLKESVEITFEPINFSSLENISTTANYNFDIVDKFCE